MTPACVAGSPLGDVFGEWIGGLIVDAAGPTDLPGRHVIVIAAASGGFPVPLGLGAIVLVRRRGPHPLP